MSRKKIIEAYLFTIDGGFHDRARGISKSVEIILDILLFWGYEKINIKFPYFSFSCCISIPVGTLALFDMF